MLHWATVPTQCSTSRGSTACLSKLNPQSESAVFQSWSLIQTLCRYKIRDDLAYENLRDLQLRSHGSGQPHDKISAAGTVHIFNNNMDDSLTWDFVQWVNGVTKLPVFVKVL